MLRLKTLSVLAGIIAALAISATPAFAEFESTTKPAQKQGNVNILKAGEFKDEGVPVKCPASEIKAQYNIQVKGQIKAQQTETTKGPALNIQVKSWGTKCIAEVLGSKVPAEVSGQGSALCDLHLVQRQKTEASGGVSSACIIKIGAAKSPTCELIIPAGMETNKETDQGINVGLKKVVLGNSGANAIATAEINGGGTGQKGGKILAVQVPGHSLCPVPTNEKAELLEFEGEAVGLNA